METAEVSRPTIKNSDLTKVERYKWKVKDLPGRYMRLPKDKLMVDPAYQRDFNETKVSFIRANWSYVACGAVCVCRRDDGTFWVIDGQHRVMAAKARADVSHLDCMVFEISSVKEEAKGFLSANTGRKPLTSLDKFKAQIIAGDPIAIEAQKLLMHAGYIASKNEKARGVRSISSILHCLKVDADAFRSVWPAIVAAAQGHAIMERTIYGLFWIEKNRAGDSLSDPKWLKRLAQVGQDELLTAAAKASAYYARGGMHVWGPGMLLVINKRMQEKFRVVKASE